MSTIFTISIVMMITSGMATCQSHQKRAIRDTSTSKH
jgi:hypothetical protein